MARKPRGEPIGESFVPLVSSVLESVAWISLPPVERCLLIELRRKVGSRPQETNGAVWLSVRHAADLIGCSPKRALAAFHLLQARGFLQVVTLGALGVEGHGRATTYRLTCCGSRGNPRPTREFQQWAPGSDFPVVKARPPARKRAAVGNLRSVTDA